jgi:hypothetical protein
MENINNTPLHIKLGIKEGFEIKLINEPDNFHNLLNEIQGTVHFRKILNEPIDMIHLFTHSKKELVVELSGLKNFVKKEGILWVPWPKKYSSYVTDLDHQTVKEIGLTSGLEDEEVCSIDDNWSALKFVHRTEDKIK